MTLDLSVVIVSYNVRDHLERCLLSVAASLQAQPYLQTEVIVIDNASVDGSTILIGRSFPDVRLQANAANIGFARAVNQGLSLAEGDAILVLNPDTIVDKEAIGILVGSLDEHPDVAVVGPQNLSRDRKVQQSRRRFPTLRLGFMESTLIQWTFPRLSDFRAYYCEDTPDDMSQNVDWVTGGCLLVRKEAIHTVGGMDERFFMYFEEVDWCWRLQRAGWRIRFEPLAKVVHIGGASADQDVTNRHILFNSSKWRFYEKWFGRFWGLVMRWYLWTLFAVQTTAEGAKLLLQHKPDLRRQRVRSYLKVLRSGLA